MDIRHYNIPHNGTAWYGLKRLEKCWSPQAIQNLKDIESSLNYRGVLSERQFEVDCFLSILADIETDEATIYELGAGWGEWCMAMKGAVQNRVIPLSIKDCYCIAVEAEPAHCEWAMEHFANYDIKGEVVYGAVVFRSSN